MSYFPVSPLGVERIPQVIRGLQRGMQGSVYETSLGLLYIFRGEHIIHDKPVPTNTVRLYPVGLGPTGPTTLLMTCQDAMTVLSPSVRVAKFSAEFGEQVIPCEKAAYPIQPREVLKLGMDVFLQVDGQGNLVCVEERIEIQDEDIYFSWLEKVTPFGIGPEDRPWVSINNDRLIFHPDSMPQGLQVRYVTSSKEWSPPMRGQKPVQFLVRTIERDQACFVLSFKEENFYFIIEGGKIAQKIV